MRLQGDRVKIIQIIFLFSSVPCFNSKCSPTDHTARPSERTGKDREKMLRYTALTRNAHMSLTEILADTKI